MIRFLTIYRGLLYSKILSNFFTITDKLKEKKENRTDLLSASYYLARLQYPCATRLPTITSHGAYDSEAPDQHNQTQMHRVVQYLRMALSTPPCLQAPPGSLNAANHVRSTGYKNVET